jgi:hypothetical protein
MYRVSFILGVYSLKWNVQNKVFIHRKWNVQNQARH